MPVRSIVGKLAQVASRWNVASVVDVVEDAHGLSQPGNDQLGGQGRKVNPDPLTLQLLGGDQHGGATAERVEPVLAVTGWSREASPPEYRDSLKCESWEMIVPELVFEPAP